MADDETPSEHRRGMGTSRLEAFSDGVFAIAITLLVLEIGVPAGSSDDLLGAVADQWPSYLAYLISFSTIGAVWLAHSAITDYLYRANLTLQRLNLLLLLVVAFLPFPTRLVAEYIREGDAERVATTIYGLNLFLVSVLVSVVWRYAVHAKLLRPDADSEEIQVLTRRLTPGLAGYVVLIVLGLFAPTLAVLGYLLIAVYLIVPAWSLRAHRP
ncbi:MAG: TMEM175 family protein [Actinomycetota bacterium]|nr:TMEM175 family protein [Actinomycetota bacterium]MDH5278500.1 TMEM175 family protein [Actinomycetota bacterium]